MELGTQDLENFQKILQDKNLNKLNEFVISASETFEIPEFNIIQDTLGFNIIKGGNSNQKADILLDIENSFIKKEDEGFGIKSYYLTFRYDIS